MEYRGPKSIFRMVISKHPRASNRNTRARASSHPMSLFLLPSSPLCPLSSTDHSTIFQVLVWSARRYSMYFFGGVKTRYLEYEIEMTEGTLAAQFRILSTRGWLYICNEIPRVTWSTSVCSVVLDHLNHPCFCFQCLTWSESSTPSGDNEVNHSGLAPKM